jgi:hypothetical protein
VALALVFAASCSSRVDNSGQKDVFVPGQDSTWEDLGPLEDGQGGFDSGQDTTPGEDSLPTDGGDPTGFETTLEAIQTDLDGVACLEDGFVNLGYNLLVKDLVVGSPVFVVSKKTGLRGFFAMEGAGAQHKGIMVTLDASKTYPALEPGDKITISGEAVEAYCNTQFAAEVVKITGAGAVPAAAVVAPEDLATDEGAEPFEGVRITLNSVTVASVNKGYGSFKVDGALTVDTDIFAFGLPKVGCVYSSITGFLTYSYGFYTFLPASEADLVLDSGTPCALENILTTVEAIQNSPESKTCADPSPQFVNLNPVNLTGLLITTPGQSKSGGEKMLYYAQTPEGGEYSGIALLLAGSPAPGLVVGDEVSVTGTWLEYYCLTEIQVGSYYKTGSKPELLVPQTVPATDFDPEAGDWPTKAERWEGVLVKVTGAKVAEADDYGNLITEEGLLLDSALTDDLEAEVGTTLQSVTGVVSYSFDTYRLYLRTLGDLVK